MAIYSVIPLGTGHDVLEKSIKKLPEGDVYELNGKSGWLVRFPGTSIELCSSLGLPTKRGEAGAVQPTPAVLVSALVGYYGFGPRDMWEWAKTREEP